MFSNQISWDFDLDGNTASTEYDFNATARHEIGHAAGLGHVINEDEIMHYATDIGSLQHLLSDPIYSPVIYKINTNIEAVMENTNLRILTPDFSECYKLGLDTYGPLFSFVEIYPNPTNDYLFISAQRPIREFNIHAVNGKKVTNAIEILKVNSPNRRLDLSSLSSGIYFLILQIDDKTYTQRIVKN